VAVVQIKKPIPNPETIELLDLMLAHAKAGDIHTVIILAGWDDATWSHGWLLDDRAYRRTMIGAHALLHQDLMTAVLAQDEDTFTAKAFFPPT
jgi:hypothetical protein